MKNNKLIYKILKIYKIKLFLTKGIADSNINLIFFSILFVDFFDVLIYECKKFLIKGYTNINQLKYVSIWPSFGFNNRDRVLFWKSFPITGL